MKLFLNCTTHSDVFVCFLNTSNAKENAENELPLMTDIYHLYYQSFTTDIIVLL